MHVLLTGGSRGLGAALVTALLERGHTVSSCSRTPTRFTASLAAEPRALHVTVDLADAPAAVQFVDAAVERFGPPEALVNCAAIAADGLLAMLAPRDLEAMTRVNVVAPLLITREVVRRMLAAHIAGCVVNVSSVGGLRGFNGLAAYGATKAALDGLTRGLARELGPRGIRVNSVAPGFVDTDMTHGLDDAQRAGIVRRTPLGRLGTVDDVVGPVLFLLSDAARFVTGQVLTVDGGLSV
ncbi:MAG: SDR family NAD(P)-dependent oxidoreductase [Vicinamibacterales bacterium]